MMDNLCFFKKIIHEESGEELEIAYLDHGCYVESLALDGPRLLLTYRDPESLIQAAGIKELDTLSVSLADIWRDGGESFTAKFTILTCSPKGQSYSLECMGKTVYGMKEMLAKTRIFRQRGVADILAAFAGDASVETGKFPVVTDYHFVEGERPSATLRQIADEQGAHVWEARGIVHMERFAELFAKSPAMEFTHGKMSGENIIISYTKPSGQVAAQEKAARSFTGWDEKEGRVKTSSDMPILAAAKSTPSKQTPTPNAFILGNAPIAKVPAIDFTAYGNLSVTAGQAIKLSWQTPDPQNPLNEGLPDKVVVDEVAHFYKAQQYLIRVKGAVAFVPV